MPVRAVLCNAAVTRLSTFADALHPKISLRGHLLPHSIALSMPLLPGSGCDLLGLLLAWGHLWLQLVQLSGLGRWVRQLWSCRHCACGKASSAHLHPYHKLLSTFNGENMVTLECNVYIRPQA